MISISITHFMNEKKREIQFKQTMAKISSIVHDFKRDGYVVIQDYLSNAECDKLRQQSKELIDGLDVATHPKSVFSTKHQDNDLYFLESHDKIRFLFEENVFDDKGQLNRPKHLAINKIGHGLAYADPIYKAATFKETIKEFSKAIDYVEPVVIQSMVIFKQPHIGGAVVPHEDGTFLMTEPSKVVGIWIALEDADLENGCLWFIPESHHTQTNVRMIRNPDKSGPINIFTAPPDVHDKSAFRPVPVKKGSAIIIHGHVVHKSEQNLSSRSREIYTFHIAESHNTKWCEENWIQPTETYSFPKLYDN